MDREIVFVRVDFPIPNKNNEWLNLIAIFQFVVQTLLHRPGRTACVLQRPAIFDSTPEDQFLIAAIIDSTGSAAFLRFDCVYPTRSHDHVIDLSIASGHIVKGYETFALNLLQNFRNLRPSGVMAEKFRSRVQAEDLESAGDRNNRCEQHPEMRVWNE